MTDTPVLAVRNLAKSYAGRRAVDGVTFHVAPGEIVGLLGPNGAGKTTIINMILGLLEPDAGEIAIDGIDLARRRAAALSRANFTAVSAALPGNLTVRQNLRLFAGLYAVARPRARVDASLREFGLVALAGRRCGLLSSGEQARVGLAKAMLNTPALLLLDEPTASLDPAAALALRGRIVELTRGSGRGVLWTSHNMAEVEAVCDRVLLLSRGRILLDGAPSALVREHGASSLEALFLRLAGGELA
ncbi:ABC transporter ATP-binding protein [Immundisolibacter sp.]|uniref:ABC transporter ATP-binding protein n=1 Tax=Immundisolibacter sp. TaxID=1934948 RepID=UPI002633B6C8|nr:ABC transporter ATP-binding protein [Immundisolibacter sp.]MDD3652237.1 ABC transporter ATP-binding protein [Immundisolibacter sp.]